MNYILRRNNWGKPSCDNIQKEYPEIRVINKDKEALPTDAKWVVRWATTSNILPSETPPKVINSATAIHNVFNKGNFRMKLYSNGLAPLTWSTISDWKYDGKQLPVILRPMKHSASKDLYFCQTESEVFAAAEEISENGETWYMSKFIDKDHEYRVFIANSRVLAVMEKIPEDRNSVTWGVDEAWVYVGWNDWPLEVCHVACRAFRHSGLNIGAVDVITKGDKAYVLEINSGPLLSKYYGAQMAKGIRWIIENDHRANIHFGVADNWRSYIHPVLVKEINT